MDTIRKSLTQNLTAKSALFTTYKLKTGSMFSNMKKHLQGKTLDASLALQSRDGELSAFHKNLIDIFIE